MKGKEIINFIEDWAPPKVAWEKDNVGIQVGSTSRKVKNIMLCLELTEKVLDESIKKRCNFIFTHHPFLFTPLKSINIDDSNKGKLIETLIKNNITLYSAHTNLDFAKEGVSIELAKTLKLKDIKFLANEKNNQYKIVVFIPEKNVVKISEAVFSAGGGIIGEYKNCSFYTKGIGTFEGSSNSNPTIGNKNNFEKINEVRLEFIVNKWNLNKAVYAIKTNHPYEEPAFDIISVNNNNVNYGFGAIGTLSKSMTIKEFLAHTCKSLKTNDVRYTSGKKNKIKTVAVCGGSGTELLHEAINKEADAFITADVKYHTFQEGENKILFVDAGHYETEIHSLNSVKRKLEQFIKINKESVNIFKFSGSTNSIKYYNNKRR